MIDTIKFRVPITEALRMTLIKMSRSTASKDQPTDTYLYKIFNVDVALGSWSRHINIFLRNDELACAIEFSVPKQFYGNNIVLLPLSSLPEALQTVQQGLQEQFPAIPPYKEWEILRLDLCYAWKFQDQAQAEDVLSHLLSVSRPRDSRQKFLNYPRQSFMYAGDRYTQKFYLKKPEFLKHDFSAFGTSDEGYQLLNKAEGVLRYEISMRQRLLKDLFGSHLTVHRLLEHDIIKIHQEYFNKFIQNIGKESMTDSEIFNKLKQTYGKSRAVSLYQFYQTYIRSDFDRAVLTSTYSRQTIWRNFKLLTNAKIGISSMTQFDLNIPDDQQSELFA